MLTRRFLRLAQITLYKTDEPPGGVRFRDIIWTIFVEDPLDLRIVDFDKIFFKFKNKIIRLPWQLYFLVEFTSLNKFGRASCQEHPYTSGLGE